MRSFCTASQNFSTKNICISDINVSNFKETLTDDVVSFEQPNPDCQIRMGVDDNSEMILLFFFRSICSGPCLEPTGQTLMVLMRCLRIYFIRKNIPSYHNNSPGCINEMIRASLFCEVRHFQFHSFIRGGGSYNFNSESPILFKVVLYS